MALQEEVETEVEAGFSLAPPKEEGNRTWKPVPQTTDMIFFSSVSFCLVLLEKTSVLQIKL
jgi:hypothetical protein